MMSQIHRISFSVTIIALDGKLIESKRKIGKIPFKLVNHLFEFLNKILLFSQVIIVKRYRSFSATSTNQCEFNNEAKIYHQKITKHV